MSSTSDDTFLPPPRRPINSGGLDGDTVLPSQNAPVIHAPGDVIDSRYTVIREIGRGGMGVVYEVLDAITGDHYAIKRLLPEYVSRPDVVEMFRTEGAASMRFTNKSLRFVTTQMVDMEGGIPYIVLQLIRHPTLRTVMQNSGGRFPLDTALPILSEIAAALSDLHALGYVHRDLKPENIFVDSSDTEPSIMLVDFGLSKDGGNATRTAMRGAGTERYASPEQMRGDTTSPATDVYAFGVIAYELLTGELPRYGESLTDYVPDASEPLVSLVSGCLAGRVDKRIANGAVLKSLLNDLLFEGSVDRLTKDDNDTRKPVAAPRPLRLATILSFPNLQVGADVIVDGESLPSGVDYQCEIDEGSTKSVSVIATWEGVDLYRGSVVLRGGENQAVTTRKAYRVDCDVPEWCDVKDANRLRVVFPVRGVVANPSVALVFNLGFQGKKFDELTVVPGVGVQQVGIDFGLGTVRMQDVPSGHQVRINGEVIDGEFTLAIGNGKPVSLSVRVYDVQRKVVYSETVTLEAGESKVIRVPTPVPATTPVGSTSEQTSMVKPEPISAVPSLMETSTLTRRLLLGGGIVGAIGGGGWFVMNKLTSTTKGPIKTERRKPKSDAQLTQTKTTNKPAARRIGRQYPRLADYVESMCVIKAGQFQMGSSSGDSDEKPLHSVTLSAFRMGATPVTVAVWDEYCRAKDLKMPNSPDWGWIDDHPVVNVSWNDIMGTDGKSGFCAWASVVAGFRLTLPTEAQFEYASRGGQSGLEYPWGNTFDDSKLWCSAKTSRSRTAPVVRSSNIFSNQPYGLTDMAGNVWQWCSDRYGPYTGTEATNPVGPEATSDNDRCVRGGSWNNFNPGSFRCALRIRDFPDLGDYIGFRLSAGLG